MPERGVRTEMWSDYWFQGLNIQQRYLFVYLWSNDHCNQAGLYQITLATLSFETLITKEDLPEILKSLSPKVEWYPDENLIWVKNFLRRQAKSPSFLVGAGKVLLGMKNQQHVVQYLTFNKDLNIPYEMPNVSVQDFNHEELAAITQCYEENIGMLTPIVAEQLKTFVDDYPPGWFEKATKEAVLRGKRNIAYILAILKRWSVEGIDDKPRGNKKEARPIPGVEVEK